MQIRLTFSFIITFLLLTTVMLELHKYVVEQRVSVSAMGGGHPVIDYASHPGGLNLSFSAAQEFVFY